MPQDGRIETALARALALAKAEFSPPLLAAALPYAVFPGARAFGQRFFFRWRGPVAMIPRI